LFKTTIVLKKNKHQSSSRWSNNRSLGLRGLLSLWSHVRALWLLVRWSLEAYIVVNFRAREISRGARKLARIVMLIKKTNKHPRYILSIYWRNIWFHYTLLCIWLLLRFLVIVFSIFKPLACLIDILGYINQCPSAIPTTVH
jgi:uncharacterized membrane protein